MNLTVNDFFCGCGGVGLGFKNAGFDVIWACDFNKYAVETYKHNVGDYVIQADIKKLIWSDVPAADVWAFGFPCQDLSVAGKRKGFRFICKDCGEEWEYSEEHKGDTICPKCGSKNYQAASRSGMFFEIMRLLDETQLNASEKMPSVLFAENVKGLKPYIPALQDELKKRGYIAQAQLYNSKYWNVPQSRERYFIVAFKEDIDGFEFLEEQHEYIPKLSSVLDEVVDEKYYISDEKAQKIIEQALERLASLGKCHATLTPDRVNKRQCGPRAKENEKEMFTLTAQDIHGVIIDDTYGYDGIRLYSEAAPTIRAGRQGQKVCIAQRPRGNNRGNIFEHSPTLTSHSWQENNYLCEITDKLRHETGLLNLESCAKTLRVGGGGSLTKKHNYQHLLQVSPNKPAELSGPISKEYFDFVINDRGFVNKPPQISDIFPTLRAENHGNHPKVVEKSQYRIRVRKLTPTEYGRLQAFPMDSWEQVVSDSQAYKQFGNAVTVSVVEAIAESIKAVLDKEKAPY